MSLPDTTWLALSNYVAAHVAPDAMVYTDEHAGYSLLRPAAPREHRARARRVRPDCHTQGIESFWSLFKRGYHGTFHHLSEEHLNRYVREFTGRNNIRDLDTIDQIAALVRGMVRKRLTYRGLVAG